MNRLFKACGIAVALVAVLTGCSLIIGADGTAYVEFTYDSTTSYGNSIDGMLWSGGGFPDFASSYEYYEVEPGSYTLEYVLYDHNWYEQTGDSYDDYNTTFNDYAGNNVYTDYWSGSDWSANVPFYANNLFDTYANLLFYTITVDEGKLFTDGDDTYFTVYLDWNTSYSDITSLGTDDSDVRIVEDTPELLVKEITDGAFTLRVEIPKIGAAATAKGIEAE